LPQSDTRCKWGRTRRCTRTWPSALFVFAHSATVCATGVAAEPVSWIVRPRRLPEVPRLLPTTVALRTLKGQQLPPRCRITVEQAADWLRRLTGQDFGTDAAAWSEWLKQHLVRGRLAAAPEFAGVVEMRPGLECRIRLDSGNEVSAAIPRQVAHRMFGVVPGNRVRIRLLEPGCSQVVGFAHAPDAEPHAAPDPAI